MRLIRALRDFFVDLFQGDPVALIVAGVILVLATLVAIIWFVDRRQKRKEEDRKRARNNPRTKPSPTLKR